LPQSHSRFGQDHALVEADARVWFYGDEAIGQPPLAYADNHGGQPTLSRKMMEECREMLISSGVLPAPVEGEAPRDVATYCAEGLTTVID
jgi:hypothetical protein